MPTNPNENANLASKNYKMLDKVNNINPQNVTNMQTDVNDVNANNQINTQTQYDRNKTNMANLNTLVQVTKDDIPKNELKYNMNNVNPNPIRGNNLDNFNSNTNNNFGNTNNQTL